MGLPETFLDPGPTRVHAGQGLVLHAPTRLSALGDVHEAGSIAGIGVVVASEEHSVVVEGEFLRVAKSGVEHLEVRSIRFAAEHGSGCRILEPDALLADDVVPTITDRPVEPTIGPPGQAVHVMAAQRNADAESLQEGLLRIGDSVAIRITEHPEVGNVRVVDRATMGQHPGAGSIQWVVVAIGIDRARICTPITVLVDEAPNPVLVLGVVFHAVGSLVRPLPVHRQSILHRLQRDVVKVPVGLGPRVLDTTFLPGGFRDVHPTLCVDAERHRVDQHRIRRPGLHHESRLDFRQGTCDRFRRCGRLERQ